MATGQPHREAVGRLPAHTFCCYAGLSVELLVLILSWLPFSKAKLSMMTLGKAWYAAMADPMVHLRLPSGGLSMGPCAPRLEAAIPAAIPALDVTCGIG